MGQGSFKNSRLGVCFKHASAKTRNGLCERNFGFLHRHHSAMKELWTILTADYSLLLTHYQLLRTHCQIPVQFESLTEKKLEIAWGLKE